MQTVEHKVSTTNKVLDPEKPQKISVVCEYSVPESIDEAVDFFGGEEKLVDAIASDVARRKGNAARPSLRDSETALDWQAVAQQIGEDYKPGRKGGFGKVQLSKTEAEEAAVSGDIDALLALLASRGVAIID